MSVRLLILFVVSYFLGNINGSVLVSNAVAHDDVRQHGSGNAGFTNFFRNYGGASAMVVFLIDAGKAIIACLFGKMLLSPFGMTLEGASLAAAAVGLGHDFPILLNWKGGKGIVCGFSAALIMDWRAAAVAFVVFALIYFRSKYVSLSSITAAAALALSFLLWNRSHPYAVAACVFMCATAIFMHRENISRLLNRSERKTDFFKKENPS